MPRVRARSATARRRRGATGGTRTATASVPDTRAAAATFRGAFALQLRARMAWQNRTKVVVTLGPASNHESRIVELVRAGADVFRIHCAHTRSEERRVGTNI